MMGPEEQHHRGGKNQKPNTRRDTMTLRSGKSLPLAGDRKDDDVANLSPPRLRPEPSFHEIEEGNRYDLDSRDRDLESSQHALGQKRGQSPGGWSQPEAVRRDVMERLRMSVPSESARNNSSNSPSLLSQPLEGVRFMLSDSLHAEHGSGKKLYSSPNQSSSTGINDRISSLEVVLMQQQKNIESMQRVSTMISGQNVNLNNRVTDEIQIVYDDMQKNLETMHEEIDQRYVTGEGFDVLSMKPVFALLLVRANVVSINV